MTKLILAAVAALSICLGARALEQDTDGYYMLGSVQDWKDFAALVETDPTANAKMTADIDLDDDQTMISSNTTNTKRFKGIFDGQGHTLSVAYNQGQWESGHDAFATPFPNIEGATIKNLHVAGTMESQDSHTAGIAANVWGEDNVIEKVWISATITGHYTGYGEYAAFVGCMKSNSSITISDCLFTGTVNGSGSNNGGFIGYCDGGNTSISSNCLSIGTFNYGGTCVFARGTASNCYYEQFPFSADNATQATATQLADGTTATALQAGREETVWVQGDDGPMLAIFVREKETITWFNDDGTKIDTTEVVTGTMPTHADPVKAADAPYRYLFAGWTPALEAAVSNTTYAATFQKIADLALVESDWTAADGDTITGETTYNVSIPGGAKVTINGVSVTGIGGGAAVDAPEFADDGESVTTKFEKGDGNTWKITAFAEMSNESHGTDVTDGQIKVYSADTLEELKNATIPVAGATVKETKSAVKTVVEVPAPSGKDSQFFRVDFGE